LGNEFTSFSSRQEITKRRSQTAYATSFGEVPLCCMFFQWVCDELQRFAPIGPSSTKIFVDNYERLRITSTHHDERHRIRSAPHSSRIGTSAHPVGERTGDS